MTAPLLDLAVVIPTFNEQANVATLVAHLDRALGGIAWEAIFVDDNSPDGTADAARELARVDRRVRVIQRIGRRGLSSACIEGMCATAAPFAPRIGRAQQQQPAWPNGPVRVVVPFPPGGSVDTLARLVQQRLQQEIGAPVVVDNRPGASGALGTAAAARAAPDGQTFVFVFDTHAVNPFLVPNLGFDTKRDLAPLMLIGTAPMLVTAHRSRPWRTLGEVVAAAKAKPDAIT